MTQAVEKELIMLRNKYVFTIPSPRNCFFNVLLHTSASPVNTLYAFSGFEMVVYEDSGRQNNENMYGKKVNLPCA
jgi:hypothetical protein